MADNVNNNTVELGRVIFQGTELKYQLDITCEGFDMLQDDFKVIVKTGTNREVTITKGEMILTENDKFIFTIDTAILGTGKYYLTVVAYVPDEDFDDGLRTEVMKETLCEVMSA